ncbi:GNAT family N-acetyltransferase [Ornithinibacillus halotolerans]|uniref:N-acetyltransferase n=1 Tax=Ornithinibacillus halotolerans TaxID=1274357 RepID=A0A916S862_9BACI|nr:GNAT family N-acetyltransferase [Ornithinibacillus halotolerans]GGA85510.1 N-acetyltransferase [Ornithinibacillus halotolerans]
MTIKILPVTKENIRDCVKLEVSEEQKEFVARNIATIAWAYVDDTFTPYAICHEDTVVGLAAVEHIPENDPEDKHWIPRFMIGEGFQGKGYGKKAMKALIEMISSHEDCDRIRLSVVTENEGAIEFYQKLGFLMTEEIIENELVMEYFV